MLRFSIDFDRQYILPTLRLARKVNPELYLFASPWSPPGWMKANGSMLGGSMRKHSLGVYAKYIVKFLQAYAAEGVTCRLAPTFTLDLRPSFCFLKPFPHVVPKTIEKSPSNTHSPPRPSQTPATSFNRLYRKSRHWPPFCAGFLLGGTCDKVLTVSRQISRRAAPLEANSPERNLRVFSKLLGQGDAIDISPRVLAGVGVMVWSRG